MYRKTLKISLILVYIVIIAGAVVRMTGSGMGCPDWPKCFGYIIPPTDAEELIWQPDHQYKEGQVIIVNESLYVATSDFVSGQEYKQEYWRSYEKHDYAVFNVWHTWIEYINRLAGALGGIAVFVMAILSFWWWNKSKKITLFSWLAVFMMGFQGWLGATVVYSVLDPVRITIHMIMALLIVAVLIYLLYASATEKSNKIPDALFRNTMIFAVLLTLVQIAIGTQVRQYVDDQITIVGYTTKSEWMANPTVSFYIHRSFSIVVVVVNLFLLLRNKKLNLKHNLINWVFVLIALEAITGILMYYIDFPFGSQPLHLVLASLLFGVQFFILLESFSKTKYQANVV